MFSGNSFFGGGGVSAGAGGSGTPLPEVSPADNGKVLKAQGGEWVAAEPDVALPEVTADDNGKTLKVKNGEWVTDTPDVALPEINADDEGKYLKVKDGEWVKAKGGAGGVSSWNDLEDKPFDSHMETIATWDGTVNYNEVFDIDGNPVNELTWEFNYDNYTEDSPSLAKGIRYYEDYDYETDEWIQRTEEINLYKVSDVVPDFREIISCGVLASDNQKEYAFIETYENYSIINSDSQILIIYEDNTELYDACIMNNNYNFTFQEKGVYIVDPEYGYCGLTFENVFVVEYIPVFNTLISPVNFTDKPSLIKFHLSDGSVVDVEEDNINFEEGMLFAYYRDYILISSSRASDGLNAGLYISKDSDGVFINEVEAEFIEMLDPKYTGLPCYKKVVGESFEVLAPDNIDGLKSVDINYRFVGEDGEAAMEIPVCYVKVSDYIGEDKLLGSYCHIMYGNEDNTSQIYEYDSDDNEGLRDMGNAYVYYGDGGLATLISVNEPVSNMLVYESDTCVAYADFDEPGLYFVNADIGVTIKVTSVFKEPEEIIKKIDVEFMPDGYEELSNNIWRLEKTDNKVSWINDDQYYDYGNYPTVEAVKDYVRTKAGGNNGGSDPWGRSISISVDVFQDPETDNEEDKVDITEHMPHFDSAYFYYLGDVNSDFENYFADTWTVENLDQNCFGNGEILHNIKISDLFANSFNAHALMIKTIPNEYSLGEVGGRIQNYIAPLLIYVKEDGWVSFDFYDVYDSQNKNISFEGKKGVYVLTINNKRSSRILVKTIQPLSEPIRWFEYLVNNHVVIDGQYTLTDAFRVLNPNLISLADRINMSGCSKFKFDRDAINNSRYFINEFVISFKNVQIVSDQCLHIEIIGCDTYLPIRIYTDSPENIFIHCKIIGNQLVFNFKRDDSEAQTEFRYIGNYRTNISELEISIPGSSFSQGEMSVVGLGGYTI